MNKTINNVIKIVIWIVFVLLVFEILLRIGGVIFYEVHINTHTKDADFTILSIGESTTYGWGVQSYSKRLEFFLNENAKDISFAVINRGVPGQKSVSIREDIESQIQKYNPDLIISLFGVNDLAGKFDSEGGNIIKSLRTYKFIQVLIGLSNIRTLNEKNNYVYIDGTLAHGMSINQLITNYEEIIYITTQHNISIVPITYISCGTEETNRLIINLSKKHSLTFVQHEQEVIYKQERIRCDQYELIGSDRWHPNDAGHVLMATNIFNTLVKEKLVPIS